MVVDSRLVDGCEYCVVPISQVGGWRRMGFVQMMITGRQRKVKGICI